MIDKCFTLLVKSCLGILESFEYDDFIDLVMKFIFSLLILLVVGIMIGAIGAGITGEMSINDVGTVMMWMLSPVLFFVIGTLSAVIGRHIYRVVKLRFKGLTEVYPEILGWEEGDDFADKDNNYAFRFIGMTDDNTAVVKIGDEYCSYKGGYRENLKEIGVHRLMLFFDNRAYKGRRPPGGSSEKLREKVEKSYTNQKIKAHREIEEMISEGRLIEGLDEDSGIYGSEISGKPYLKSRA